MAARDVHLNLVESTRQLFEADSGAEIEAGGGCLFGSGRSSHPVISNAAFRAEDEVDPEDFIGRAREFFAGRGRGFAIWARTGVPEDESLLRASEEAGMRAVIEMPEMVLRERSDRLVAPPGVEIRRVEAHADASKYWAVAAEAYGSLGFPSEAFAFNDNDAALIGGNTASFLARIEGRAVGIAMTIVTRGIAGIYWVGTTEAARGRGVGTAITAAAVEAGFEMGAGLASLQASPMGEGLYRRMGFETIHGYRLLAQAPG